MTRAETNNGASAQFRILGPLQVVVDGREVAIATRRQRALLVLLLMNVGRVVSSERLIDQLWDGAPPPQAGVTLRSYVSNLRQALGQRGLASVLVTRAQGYCLDVPPGAVDAVSLKLLAEEGREHLRHGEPEEALAAFEEAIRHWGGDPLAEIADHEIAQSTIAQLTETYLAAAEARFEALLATGRHTDAIPDLEAFAADHPLREEPRALLMLALYRAGRAADALGVHRRFRKLLQDELGIDPSARLDQLNQRILEQDPQLDPAPQARPSSSLRPESQGPSATGAQDEAPALLVGRRHELSVIGGHIDDLTRGAGGLLLVAGEPGIGKTTLLEALEKQARDRGVAVHSGRAPAATGAPAFWPWSQIVDSIARSLDEDGLTRAMAGAARPVAQLSQVIAERTGDPIPMTGDNLQALRFLLYEGVSAFIRQASDGHPILITLDDVHWADVPSLELISYLTPSLAARPVLLVAAYRDLPADRSEALADTLATVSREDAASELALSGLTAEDVATLTHQLLDDDAPDSARDRDGFAELLYERTGGNPFFIRQMARLVLDADQDSLTTHIPPGVRHVIARRLDALPERARLLLASAAVVGREFELLTAAAAADVTLDEALDAYDDAARHGLLERSDVPGVWRFVHALVQEAVLDQVPGGRAARLHAAAAEHLQREGTPSPERLAEHLWAARDIVGDRAISAQVAAADTSAAVFAAEQAEAYLRRALQLVESSSTVAPETELTVLLRLVRLLTAARGWGDPEMRSLVDRTLGLSSSGVVDDTVVRLWWSIFFYLLDRGDRSFADVVRSLEAAAADAPELDHASRAAIQLAGILAALDRDDRASAGHRLAEARRHVEAAPTETLAAYDEHLHVMLLLIEASGAALSQDADGHDAAVGAAIALADADGRPFPRTVARALGVASAAYLLDIKEAATYAEWARTARDMAERFSFRWLATLAGCLTGWAEARLGGDIDEAALLIEQTMDDLIAAGRRGNLAPLNLMLADLRMQQGERDKARQALLAAHAEPSAYRGLVVDVVEQKLSQLG